MKKLLGLLLGMLFFYTPLYSQSKIGSQILRAVTKKLPIEKMKTEFPWKLGEVRPFVAFPDFGVYKKGLSSYEYAVNLDWKPIDGRALISLSGKDIAKTLTSSGRAQVSDIYQTREYLQLLDIFKRDYSHFANRLEEQGVLVGKLDPQDKIHYFSKDGITWHPSDKEEMVLAVADGYYVQVHFTPNEEIEKVLFSVKKDFPSFEFYNKDLFREMDRSLAMGMTIKEEGNYVVVSIPQEYATKIEIGDTGRTLSQFQSYAAEAQIVTANPVTRTYSWERATPAGKERLIPGWTPLSEETSGLIIPRRQGSAVGDEKYQNGSLEELNDWFMQAKRAVSPQQLSKMARTPVRLVYTEGVFLVKDGRGQLHDLANLNDIIQRAIFENNVRWK